MTNLLDQRARLILDDAARSEHFYRERLVFLAAKFFPSMSDTDRARIVTRAVTLHEEAGAPLPDGPPKDDSKLPPVRVYSGPELAELAGAAPADSTDGAQADFRAEGDPASASENGVTPTPTTETKPMPKKTEAPAPTPPEDTTVMIQRMPGGRVHLVCTGEPREILKVARALLEDAA